MDFQTLLTKRRSIRDFQSRQVPLSLVKEILQDSCLAPTASNGQPCRFIIVQDRDCLKRLSEESKKNFLANIQRNPDSPVKMYEAVLKDANFNVFYNAPCAIFVIGPKKFKLLDADGALTIAYLMFSAAARGLGTCWIALGSHLRDHEILNEIGMPEDCRIVAPVIIGYPAGIPPASERHAPAIVKII
ncbi:MAG: nitroreductase family protein [Pseudomonadota bacterium]